MRDRRRPGVRQAEVSSRNPFTDRPLAGSLSDHLDINQPHSEELSEVRVRDSSFPMLGRGINELIEARAMSLEFQPDSCLFVCECDNGDCEEQIQLTLPRLRAIREDSSTFVVVAGHESWDDLVLKREASWLIVKKPHPDHSAETGVA